MRLLATQFESERQERDFDSSIRVLQHAREIRNIYKRRSWDLQGYLRRTLQIKHGALPVTESEMRNLEDRLIQKAQDNKHYVTLNLPIRSKDTCWNSTLTQEEKDAEVFISKCGECHVLHEFPRCEQCKKPRHKSGPCSECNYAKEKEDYYEGYCGNCFQKHEFPNCIQCQHYRLKPGRCTNCGAIGPDNTEWIYSCLGHEAEHEELIRPILEARKKKVDEESKKFTTYRNCPFCRGYFHAAKACIFRTHVKHFNILKDRMEMFENEDTTTKMIVPTTDSEESSDSEEEESDGESSDGDQTYMLVTRPRQQSDDDEDMEQTKLNSRFGPIDKFDKILSITRRQREETVEEEYETVSEEEEDEDEQEEFDDYIDDQDEDNQDDDQDEDEDDQGFHEQSPMDEDDTENPEADAMEEESSEDQEQPGQADETQPEEHADQEQTRQAEENQPEGHQEGEQTEQKDTKHENQFREHPSFHMVSKQLVSTCELNKENFGHSVCKILPDTAEFPEDIFTVEGCIWCGSKGHDIFSCLGYATWLGDLWMTPREEGGRLTYPQRQRRIEAMLKLAKDHYYNPRRPWEIYIGLDNGEYLTAKGVKIQIKDKKILNLIPRHLQTTTTIYADLPTAKEMREMMQLSTSTEPAAQTTVMEEICNQAIAMKEDLIDLEIELKKSLGIQITEMKKEVKKELSAITSMVDDKVSSLPQQLVSFREYLSKSLSTLHTRSLQSEITLVESYRSLSDAKSADSCMTWRSTLCEEDPSYNLRGRWLQLSDRLNSIVEFTIRKELSGTNYRKSTCRGTKRCFYTNW